MKLTRRDLVPAISLAALPAAARSQQPAAPVDELQAARDRLKANIQSLGQHSLPMATEPAFRFKA